jgi:hypothetical protein
MVTLKTPTRILNWNTKKQKIEKQEKKKLDWKKLTKTLPLIENPKPSAPVYLSSCGHYERKKKFTNEKEQTK